MGSSFNYDYAIEASDITERETETLVFAEVNKFINASGWSGWKVEATVVLGK